jgi:hypothetical protein
MIGMRSPATPDRRLARLAGRQHGVVSRAQLYEMGFDNPAVERRSAAGRLHRLHRGAYAVGHTIVPPRGRWLAAVMACGPGAVLSHRSAAALWGIRPTAAARIDVTVPHTSGFRSTARIVVHRSRRPIEALRLDGIPVTTAGRTLADLATALPRRELEKAAETAEALKLHVVVDPSHPGAKRLADIDHDLTYTTRSPAGGRLPGPVRPLRDPAAARECEGRGVRSRLLLAGGAADRGDRRPAPPHARRVRARSRTRRGADRARMARHARDESADAAAARRRGARAQRA